MKRKRSSIEMKAAVYSRYGGPEVVSIMQVSKPVPKNNEILIKVHVTTVNRTDCAFRSASHFLNRIVSGIFKPKHPVLGNEFAGEVEAVGKDVTLFRPGMRVFGYNDSTFGAHAEYMVIAESKAVAEIPGSFTYEEMAAVCEGGHYALCDIRAAKVTVGQNTLVYGASGAIGSAAVQLLKELGATVTTVCDTRHLKLMESLGADFIIDYTTKDYTETNQRYDFIYDAVGKTSFGKCKSILKEKGIYKSTEPGKNGQNIFFALFTRFTGGKRVIFPIPSINREDAMFLGNLVEKGTYRPVIDRSYPLGEIADAYSYVETGQKTGNVIIHVQADSKQTSFSLPEND